MRTQIKISLAIVGMSSFFGSAGSAFAFFAMDTSLTLGDHSIFGKCEMIITDNEPYSHMNSHCNVVKDDLPIWELDLTNFVLGWPRSGPRHDTWVFLQGTAPEANSEYCVEFGEPFGTFPLTVYFGHHSDSSQNTEEPGDSTCKLAVPQVKAHYQAYCIGSYVWVFSVTSLIPGVHRSYRTVAQPLLCWEFAVIE